MKFYRYTAVEYATYDSLRDEYVSPLFPDPRIECTEYELVSETPCGYWIRQRYGNKFWVSKTARKRYAYPTKQEALANYIARTKRYIQILSSRLDSAKVALARAERAAETGSTTVLRSLETPPTTVL